MTFPRCFASLPLRRHQQARKAGSAVAQIFAQLFA